MMPNIIDNSRSVIGASARLLRLLDEPGEKTGGKDFSNEVCDNIIEFQNVTFSYDGIQDVIKNLSFQITKGKTIALVGESGSGKSTILKLICGFYQPKSGSIKLYGQDLKLWDISKIREKISYVPQDAYLFHTTIAKNIQLGKIGAAETEIYEASENANVCQFISELSNGYDTLVSERGGSLSGGQRQQISIARAFLKNAPILLIDEGTSELDVKTDLLVQEAIRKMMKNKTVIIIAHRLSTIKYADEIIVLDKGVISERGNHEELMKLKGSYYNLFLRQIRGCQIECVNENSIMV